MSYVSQLINEARYLGAQFGVKNERVTISARVPLPASLVEKLREHRSEVQAILETGKELSHVEIADLMAWAWELSEQYLDLTNPVRYLEAAERTITTERVSWYATHYLRNIAYARLNQKHLGWSPWTSLWWQEREEEALNALGALRAAIIGLDEKETSK